MHFVVYAVFFSSFLPFTSQIEVEYQILDNSQSQQCTYFGTERGAKIQRGLVNCSWYATKACCKTTEVTSVFSTMFPLYGASKACQNQMNYMMCYFCDPDQHAWYNEETDHQVHICADFCRMVYDSCKTAQYNGSAIGDFYGNETSFCQAQNFHMIEGKKNCFNFDPTVFDSTTSINLNITAFIGIITMVLLLQNCVYKM